MTECPDLETLQALGARSDLQEHVSGCESCRIVLELVEERNLALDRRDRRALCARFEMLIAAREDGSLSASASEFLDDHLRCCSVCTLVANTLRPLDRSGTYLGLEPVLTSRYTLGREVARGGMGRIIAAQDLRVGRPVALKELLENSPSLAARFEREARVTARLQHPRIVPIYEIGKWPDGTPFYTMRMVDGRTLRDTLRDATTLDERLPLLPVVIAAAEAIAFAHARTIIHRDLTPNNILVGDYGETVVIDWGLAKDLSVRDEAENEGPYRDEHCSPGLTSHGAVIGTAAFMPPEQARGEAVDERADVYALGAILYHLLAGVPPYAAGPSDEVVNQVKEAPPRPIDELAPNAPRDLLSIVNKAMAREPALRYRTAQGILDELRRFQTGRIVEAHHYSRTERTRRWVRQHRMLVVSTTATIVAIAIAGTLGMVGVMRERDRAEARRQDAETQRSLARTQAAQLLEESGRQELLAGNPLRAALWLSAAYSAGNTRPSLRLLLGTAMRYVEAHVHTFACPSEIASIDRIDLTPDGQILAVPCHDEVRLWNTRDGSLAKTLRAPNASVNGVRFSHDGRTLVAVGRDPSAWVWDRETGELRATLRGHFEKLLGTAFSPDDRYLITSSMDGTVRTWDVATGTLQLAILAAAPGQGVRAGYLGDGSSIVTATTDGTIKRWNARTGALVRSVANGSQILSGDIQRELSSEMPAPADQVVVCGVDGFVTIWNLETGTKLRSFAAHADTIWTCMSSPNRSRLLTTGSDGSAKIWDLASGRLVLQLEHGGFGQSGGVFTQDDRRIFTLGSMRARLWDAESGVLLATYDGGLGRALAIDRTGDHLYGIIETGMDHKSTVHSIHGLGASRMSGFSAGVGGRIAGLDEQFSHAAVQRGRDIELWNVATHKPIPHAPLHEPGASGNRRFAAASAGGISVLDLTTGADVTELAVDGAPSAVAISDDGKKLLVKTASGTRLWDVDAKHELQSWPSDWTIYGPSIDMRVVAAWHAPTKTIALWDIAGRRVVGQFTVESDHLKVVGFDRTSNRLVLFVGDNGAGHFEIRGVPAGDLLARIDGPMWDFAANLDPHRTKMTVAYMDRTEIWDLGTVKRTGMITLQPSLVGAQLSADGTLAALSDPLNARLNIMDPTDGRLLLSQAIHRPGASLGVDSFQIEIPFPWFGKGDERIATFEPQFLSFISLEREYRPADVVARIVANELPWHLENTKVVLDEPAAPRPATASLRGRITRNGALVADGGVWISDLGRVASMDGKGNYELHDLPTTSLRVHAGSPSLKAWSTARRHTLRPGDNTLDVDLDVDASIAGTVRGASGQPLTGTQVIVYCKLCADPIAGHAAVDAGGQFLVDGLRRGERYTLLVVDPRGTSYRVTPDAVDIPSAEAHVTGVAARAEPLR